MKKKLLDGVKLIVFLAVGIFFIWFFVKDLTEKEKEQIFESFSHAKYLWLFVGLIFALISHILRSLRWEMLLNTVGYKPKFKNTFLSLMIGYFANLALPRLGEITRCGILNKYEKIPFEKSFGTVVAERALDLLSFVALFFINLLIQYDAISGYVSEKIYQPLSQKFEFVGKGYFFYGSILLMIVFIVFLFVFHKKLLKYRIYQKIIKLFKGFWAGLISIGKVKRPVLFVLYTISIWAMYFLMTYICFFSLTETSSTGADAAFSVLIMGTIGIMVVQGGIGIYPVIVAETLAVPKYGVNNITGFTLGWLIWIAQTAAIILSGIISLILLPVLNNKKNDTTGNHQK